MLPYIPELFASSVAAYTDLQKAEGVYVLENFELCQMMLIYLYENESPLRQI